LCNKHRRRYAQNQDFQARVIYGKEPARFDEPSTQAEIGEETHTLVQFIRVETGDAVVVLDGVKHQISLKVSTPKSFTVSQSRLFTRRFLELLHEDREREDARSLRMAATHFEEMAMHPNPTSSDVHTSSPEAGLRRVLGGMSVFTLLMTIPQVLTIWIGHQAAGVSIFTWSAYLLSAILWFWYGIQKQDKNIYLPCIGWMALDIAVIVGVVIYG
jgi:uncharacterized protein with PQ loop repeat